MLSQMLVQMEFNLVEKLKEIAHHKNETICQIHIRNLVETFNQIH